MLEFFTNPGFLAVAAALVSAPIIIHLINRMRFKRVAWAAMEFLLKAQKRTRRRLIIEQLLLLLLRCVLVALVGLLVLRFLGFSDGDFSGKRNLSIVLVDDTLSMQDRWTDGDKTLTSFQAARARLLDKIAKEVSMGHSSDQLMILPMSKLVGDPGFEPRTYDHLNDEKVFKEMKGDVDALEPTFLHVDPFEALKKVRAQVAGNVESRVKLHLLGDFRRKDWALPEAEGMQKLLVEMAAEFKDMKIDLHDMAHPFRSPNLPGGYPPSHDNVGIVDLRPSTRVAGRNMPVTFTVSIANYSDREQDINVLVTNEETGAEMLEVDFNPPMPVKLAPGKTLTANFDLRFTPTLKPGESHFAHISARLRTPGLGELVADGIQADNVRQVAVEVREKVPVLVIDGEGPKGREENRDSFFLENSLISVPGASYRVVYGDQIANGVAVKALERSDLAMYPTIFILNVREFTKKQLDNLEAYVRDGGGVGFFLGPQVSAAYYNKSLYKEGKGIFPAPLKETYYPAPSEDPLPAKIPDTHQILLRGGQFADSKNYPIFGFLLEDGGKYMEPMRDMPIRRYFQVPRGAWRQEGGKTFELATLPNENLANAYHDAIVKDVIRSDKLKAILNTKENEAVHKSLKRHFAEIEAVVAHNSEQKAYHLANKLQAMLDDRGKATDASSPNLTEFWGTPDLDLQRIRKEVANIIEQARYGDPFVVSTLYGKGKTVAVMSTAGKEWNDWAGGSAASLLFAPILWEMQNYLSSQGSEANLAVGTPVEITLDAELFKKRNEQLKLTRYFMKTVDRAAAKKMQVSEEVGREDKGAIRFVASKNNEPGLYLSELRAEGGDKALATYAHVFNVETTREGPLERLSQEDIDQNLVGKAPPGSIRMVSPGMGDNDVAVRRNDFSESPLLFLVFLLVLIAEQALAVHLSFHMRGNEADAVAQVTAPTAKL